MPGRTIQLPKGRGSSGSKAEELFSFQARLLNLPEPLREYRFSEMTLRRWRFDFAWPDLKIAVEIEGLTYYGKNPDGSSKTGRHQTARGYQEDLEKYNQAIIENWRVLRFSQAHVKSGEAIAMTQLLINQSSLKCKPSSPDKRQDKRPGRLIKDD